MTVFFIAAKVEIRWILFFTKNKKLAIGLLPRSP